MAAVAASYGRRFHYGLVVVAAGFLGVTGALGLARFGYTMILPSMREGLGMSDTQAGLLASGNLLGYLLFSLLAGALAARFGPRLVASVSLGWVGLAMGGTGLVASFDSALLMRFLTGLGSAGGNISIMGMAGAWAAPGRRGLVAGVLVGGSGLGLLIAGYLVPAVVLAYGKDGWRYAWYELGALALGIAVLCYLLLRDSPSEKGLRPLGDSGPQGVPAAPSGPAGTRSATGPVAPPTSGFFWSHVYRSRQLWHLAAIYAGWGFAYIIYATFFARYLIAEVAYDPTRAGALWSLVGTFSLFCGVLWGLAADRLGRRAALTGVFALQAVSFVAFAMATGLPWIAPFSAVLFGLTAWSTPGIMAALAGDYCGPRMAPAGLGFITFFFAIGQALGPYVGGYMADSLASFAPSFLLAALVLLVCMLGTLRLPGRGAA